MIKKLRFKFISLSMMALFVLLLAIIAGMNITNYNSIVLEADQTLSILAINKGAFPKFKAKDKKNLPPDMRSPDARHEISYFSVMVDKNDGMLYADTGKSKAVDEKQAYDYAAQAISDDKNKGFIENYRFLCSPNGTETRITFLDCGLKLDFFRTFLFISIGMALAGYLLFFFVLLFFSKKIVLPVSESYEKQKRFITDAGHEIKTPLTIIKADVDVLEMEFGENEWLTDIQKQAKRLTALTNDLVYLSRMEESGNSMPMIEFPVSDIVGETASSFQTLAQTQDKTFQCSIQPMLSMTGNEKAVIQLVNILLDNAMKYSPSHGTISLSLVKQGKTIQLSVSNTTENAIPKEAVNQLFERFYRIDPSRNSQTGGYGIGLSVAKAIVCAHNGKIQAKSADEHSLQIIAAFPA